MNRLLDLFFASYDEIKRFVKFAIVGTIGAGVDFGVLNLCILLFGFGKALANTCSFTTAVLSNFTWNRLWTFPESRQRPLGRQLGQFFLVNLVGYFINQAIFLSLDHYLLGQWGVIGYNLAKMMATIVVLAWNFTGSRLWAFRS